MTSTTGRVFIDTNVFVYAVDRAQPQHRTRANEFLAAMATSGRGVISPQVIGEFVRVACSKLASPLRAEQAEQFASRALAAFELAPIDERVVRETLRCWRRYSISFWDAQIWAAARIAGVDTIATQDRPAEEIEGIRYVDPLAEDFDVATLG